MVVVARICIASLLGGIVGFEREFKNKSGTSRMHMLVTAGSSLFAGTSAISTSVTGAGDPSRFMSGL